MPLPSTADDFIGLVQRSGVVPRQDLSGFLNRLPGGDAPLPPRDLADAMIRDGLLTRFQADLLLKGKWRQFIIGTKYKLLDHLGSGGMGSVYLCEHLFMKRRVALKVLPAAQTEPAALERFKREARAVAALDHPNIVRAHDVDSQDGLHFLVMEYVDGTSLQQLVAQHGPLDPVRAAHYAAQAALGLQHAHEAGLVHRDIKPGNVLLDRSGLVKLLDLGLARFFTDDGDQITKKHDSRAVLGTVDYLSPEQAVDSSAVDIRADIYALGMTFYFVLAGETAFGKGSMAEKLMWHQVREPRPVRSLRPEVPEPMAAVVHKMLAKSPAHRFQTPIEVAYALAAWTRTPIPPPPAHEMPSPCGLRRADGGSPSTALASSSGPLSAPSSSATRLTPSPTSSLKLAVVPSSGHLPAAAPPLPVAAAEEPAAEGKPSKLLNWVIGAVCLAVIGAMGTVVYEYETQTEPLKLFDRNQAPPPQPAPAPKPTPAPSPVARRFTGHTAAVERVAVTPDGKRAVTAGMDGTVRLWDLGKSEPAHTFAGHTRPVRWVAADPSGNLAASVGEDGFLRVWDLAGRKQKRSVQVQEAGTVWGVAFAPDGRLIATGGDDGVVRVWPADKGPAREFRGHTAGVNCVAFVPGRPWLASASWDKTVRVWDYEAGREVHALAGHTERVNCVAASPDGRHLTSGGTDKTARLWDAESGRLLHTFAEPKGSVWCLAWSPDGKRLLGVGQDPALLVWDVPGRKLLKAVGGLHAKSVPGVAHLPGSDQAVTSSHDLTAALVRLDSQKK